VCVEVCVVVWCVNKRPNRVTVGGCLKVTFTLWLVGSSLLVSEGSRAVTITSRRDSLSGRRVGTTGGARVRCGIQNGRSDDVANAWRDPR
jgi:hypothetical protein